jgi:hypothetical protein
MRQCARGGAACAAGAADARRQLQGRTPARRGSTHRPGGSAHPGQHRGQGGQRTRASIGWGHFAHATRHQHAASVRVSCRPAAPACCPTLLPQQPARPTLRWHACRCVQHSMRILGLLAAASRAAAGARAWPLAARCATTKQPLLLLLNAHAGPAGHCVQGAQGRALCQPQGAAGHVTQEELQGEGRVGRLEPEFRAVTHQHAAPAFCTCAAGSA